MVFFRTGFDEAAPCYILSLPEGGPIGHNKDQQSTNNTSQRKQWGKETRWYVFPLSYTQLCIVMFLLLLKHISTSSYVMNYSFIDLGVTIHMFYRKNSPGVVIGWECYRKVYTNINRRNGAIILAR